MKTQHMVFALVEDFTHLAFSCAVEPLRLANWLTEKELYSWSFASQNGETATCSMGAVTQTHHRFEALPDCDRLFVLSGINMHTTALEKILDVLREHAPQYYENDEED